ncbi:MAG: peptidylprolyl isomerase [bacterium]
MSHGLRVTYLILLTFLVWQLAGCSDLKQEYSRKELLAEIARAEDQRYVDTLQTAVWATDADTLVRQRVAYMIGIVGDHSYRTALRALLADTCATVVTEAIFAAGQVGDSTLVFDLLPHLDGADSLQRSRTIVALSKLDCFDASQALSRIILDSTEAVWARATAAEAAFRLTDQLSLSALVEQGRIENDLIREKIYYSLLRRADESMQRLFRIGMRDTLETIQTFSVIGAGRTNDTSSVERIGSLLDKQNWRLKYHAVSAVGRLQLKPLIKAVSNLLDESENVYVRQAAIRTLGLLATKSLERRVAAFLGDADLNLRLEALLALTRIRGAAALPLIDSLRENSDERVRAACAEAYAIVGGDTAVARIVELSSDPAVRVRVAALEQIFQLEDKTLIHKAAKQALRDSDKVPVILACDQIGQRRYLELVPALCEQFEREGDHNVAEIQDAVLEALTTLADSLQVTDQLDNLVATALQNRYYPIRRDASKLAEMLGLPSEFRPPHFDSNVKPANYDDYYHRFEANPIALLQTTRGDIRIELLYDAAPKTVINFVELAEKGFYDNRVWHRVIPDFVIQDGCPRGDGWGDPGYEIRCEYNALHYEKGSVGMATSGKDTGGSQFFICQSEQPHLDGRYTLFGRVVDGFREVTLTELGDSIFSVRIIYPD